MPQLLPFLESLFIKKVKLSWNRNCLGRMTKMVVVAYVTVTMKAGAENAVLKKIATLEEVTEANLLYGEYDALVKIKVEDLSQLDNFLTEKLRVLPDVFQTASLIVAKQHKET